MEYFSVKDIRRMDREAVIKRGIPAQNLMENAGRALAEEAMKIAKAGEIAVFCGYGNNGGDGLAAARYLAKAKYGIIAYVAGTNKLFTRETEINYYNFINMGAPVFHLTEKSDLKTFFNNISKPSVIIDAIFGIGLHGDLDSFYINLIDSINDMHSPIISADIPSGLDADTGCPLPVAIRADKTVTFGCAKKGFQNPSAKAYTGEVVVADIGIFG